MLNLFKKTTFLLSCIIGMGYQANAQISVSNGGCPWATGSGNSQFAPDGSDCTNSVTSAAAFLRIVPDARFGAMGDVGIAMPADPNSMHFNAAGLTFADRDFSLSATYTPWLTALGINDVYLAYLSAYKQIDYTQSIGANLRFFSLGEIQFTDANGQPLQVVNPTELDFSVAYARKLSRKFSTGLTVRYIFSNLGSGAVAGGQSMKPAHGAAVDLSFLYKTDMEIKDKPANLSIGLVFSNMGTKISYSQSANRDYLPANFGLGFAFGYDFDEHNSMTLGFDINKLMVPTPIRPYLYDENGLTYDNPDYDKDSSGVADFKELSVTRSMFSSFGDAPGGAKEELSELNYSLGLEYWYNKQFAIRAGYFLENRYKGNRRFFTVGLGLRYKIFNINFAYLIPSQQGQRNPLDNTLRFSLVFDFGEAPKEKRRR